MSYCIKSNQKVYPFILPELPFNSDEFGGLYTAKAFEYHHGKHHLAYVNNLNALIKDQSQFSGCSLEQIILQSYDSHKQVFNNAAQLWNHSFFWHSIMPNGGGMPDVLLLSRIEHSFGSFASFKDQFKAMAVAYFGSGWIWLVEDKEKNKENLGKLSLVTTSNADTPIVQGIRPLITCDLWEHSYYIDYYNKRADYIENYLSHMVNWGFALKQ